MKRLLIFIAVMAIVLMGGSQYSYADGIDLWSYFARFDTNGHSSIVISLLILLVMVLNYVWNVVVIGLPAISLCNAPYKTVILELVPLTFLGQIADRIGAILALPFVFVFGRFFPLALSLLIGNFLFSGIAVGLLVFYFLHKRWGTSFRKSLVISIFAAIASNPVWIAFLHL